MADSGALGTAPQIDLEEEVELIVDNSMRYYAAERCPSCYAKDQQCRRCGGTGIKPRQRNFVRPASIF